MKKAQWITAGATLLIVIGLYAFTQDQIFGLPKKINLTKPLTTSSSITIDSFLTHVKDHLTPGQISRINYLESSTSRENDPSEKIHIYHQLARFWKDSIKIADQHESFEPYAWYTAEAARLENSEKSLTFAARLFLSNFRRSGEGPEVKKWKALQARDLYERSLKLNPNNDSAQVELGEVYLYGGFAMPMEGVGMIRKVADQNEKNVYAQMALGYASLTSGQTDKAIERFKKIVQIEPSNLEATLLLADIYEGTGDKKAAINWYKKSLPLLNPQFKKEVEDRINQLNK
jgi:tetratricopeptide (TPR) repeat protein